MAERDEPIAQLATRIPKDLHRRLKLHCVTHEIALMHFVVEALEEKLGRQARGGRRTRQDPYELTGGRMKDDLVIVIKYAGSGVASSAIGRP